MCSTSACERSSPSNEVCSIFLHASLRHRVRGVRIKSCAGSGGAGKVPFSHSYLPICPTSSHLLPAAGATAALPQTAIGNGWGNAISHSTRSSTSAKERCIPREKRLPVGHKGGYGAIRIDPRVRLLRVVARSWSLPAFACLAPPHPLRYTSGTRALYNCGASPIPLQR